MKSLRTYNNHAQAGYDQSLLVSSGIEAILEHEASGGMLPSVNAIRLQVPDDQHDEADQILLDHQVHFVEETKDNREWIGFWRGGLYGMLILAGFLLLIACGGGSWYLTGTGLAMIFLVSGFAGGFIPKSPNKPGSTKQRPTPILPH